MKQHADLAAGHPNTVSAATGVPKAPFTGGHHDHPSSSDRSNSRLLRTVITRRRAEHREHRDLNQLFPTQIPPIEALHGDGPGKPVPHQVDDLRRRTRPALAPSGAVTPPHPPAPQPSGAAITPGPSPSDTQDRAS